MSLLVSWSRCQDCGAHCYSGPPRWPDEVLGHLSRPAACGIGRSLSARNVAGGERESEKGEHGDEDGSGPEASAYGRSVLHDGQTRCLPPA